MIASDVDVSASHLYTACDGAVVATLPRVTIDFVSEQSDYFKATRTPLLMDVGVPRTVISCGTTAHVCWFHVSTIVV
jgi:hypothetical protein